MIRNDIASEYVASTTSTFGSNDDSPKLDTAEHHSAFEVPEESNYLDLLPGLLDDEVAPLAQTEEVKPASNKNGQTIGKLTPEERKAKIARYLKKKEARQWDKKVQYQSRKKVADKRPRFKGRFVSEDQATELFREYQLEMMEKLRNERFFATSKVDRKTGCLLSANFPRQSFLPKNTARVLRGERVAPGFRFRISAELGWKQ